MSVVDHRAAFAAQGGRPGSSRRAGRSAPGGLQVSFQGPTIYPDMLMGKIQEPIRSGAFHSHTLGKGAIHDQHSSEKRQGLRTETARELALSRRNLGASASTGGRGSTLGSDEFNDDELGLTDRREIISSVNYGTASVRRVSFQDFGSDRDLGGGSIKSLSSSRRSIGAGEGAWLMKQQSAIRHKSSSRRLITAEKKESDEILPGMDEMTEVGLMKLNTRGMPKPIKTVQFSTVTIQYHPTILGNNPFVTSGPPLELAWEHDPSATDSNVPIDRYEEVREGRRRNEWDLTLSKGERESRLLELGCTREDIATEVRETCRIKAQRANTVLNLKMSGVEEFLEDVWRQGSKFVGLRKSSDWLYNEWKSNKNTYPRSHFSAIVAAEDVGPKVKDEAAATLHDGKKKRSPVRHAVQRIIRHGANNATRPSVSTIDSNPAPERPRGGPAFGIDHVSMSTRTGLCCGGDDDTKGVWPFAVIKVVHPGSPADEAGLRRGDRLIKLGSITALNHDRCRDIPELGQVAAAKELPIPATVEDENGVRREIAIWPHKWDGRGYFGFLFRELDT